MSLRFQPPCSGVSRKAPQCWRSYPRLRRQTFSCFDVLYREVLMPVSRSYRACGPVAAVGLLALAALPSLAQTAPASDSLDVPKQIIAQERASSDVVANLEYLSDRIGPRLTGSARLRKANDWTVEK